MRYLLHIIIKVKFCTVAFLRSSRADNHDFSYSLPIFSSLLKKEGRSEGEWIAKIVIKSLAFLLDLRCEFLKETITFNVFEIAYVLSGKGYAICKQHKMINK